MAGWVGRELQDVTHVKDGEVRARMVSALVSAGMPSQVIQAMQVSISDTYVKPDSMNHWAQGGWENRWQVKKGSMGQGSRSCHMA